MWTRSKIIAFAVLTLGACTAYFAIPPTPQPEAYHHFAGDLSWMGIPNFQNVASNLGFLIVGLMGIYQILAKNLVARSTTTILRESSTFFFFSMILLCFGSGYYHWAPTTDTLFWDRFTMVLGFMTFLSMVITDRFASATFDRTKQTLLLALLLAIGIYSVLDWRWSEERGAGDMRLYLCVQIFSLLYLLFFAFTFPERQLRKKDLGLSVAWYAVAKVLESNDLRLHDIIGGWTAGHPLKHLASAMGVYYVLKALQPRSTTALVYHL